MSDKFVLCRNATPFLPSGALDEAAFEQLMQRFVDTRTGVYIGTAGSGESHAMTKAELRRIYEIGVAVGKGKIPVLANPPEQHTPAATLEQSLIAADAGIEIVNFYGPAGWHGYKPTDTELLEFFDEIFPSFNHPVALNPNPTMGYTPSVKVVTELIRKYPQIVAVNLATQGDAYFMALKDGLPREVDLCVNLAGSAMLLSLGATGLLSAEAMVIPKTFRAYLDAHGAGDFAAMNTAYTHCVQLSEYVRKWGPSNARWLKMAMKVLGLPGGEGRLRSPYRMPPEADLKKFSDGLLALDIPEINEQARLAA